MDITPIIVTLIVVAVFVWYVLQAQKVKMPEVVMSLAEGAVRMAYQMIYGEKAR